MHHVLNFVLRLFNFGIICIFAPFYCACFSSLSELESVWPMFHLHFQCQGCQSGAMALKTAQQAIMNCLTALSGHAANARCICSTVAPRCREGSHGHTYLQPNTRACAYGRRFLRMRSARNCFGAALSAPAENNFDTPAMCDTQMHSY